MLGKTAILGQLAISSKLIQHHQSCTTSLQVRIEVEQFWQAKNNTRSLLSALIYINNRSTFSKVGLLVAIKSGPPGTLLVAKHGPTGYFLLPISAHPDHFYPSLLLA